ALGKQATCYLHGNISSMQLNYVTNTMKPQINRCLLLLTTLISLLQLQKSYSQKIDSLWTDAIQEVSAGHYDQAYPFIYQQLAADKAENTDYYYYGIASAVQTGHMDQAFEWLGD